MAVFNGEKYLREAIDSVLSQTLSDLEFIIVDDGSTDQSVAIVRSYKDPRIRLLRNDANCGLMISLNKGIDAARGRYVARMDCDDICVPERLAKQVAFMEAHPDVVASGTWAHDIDSSGKPLAAREVPVGERMEYEFWRPSPLLHPTAIIRMSQLGNTRYDPTAPHAEDYDLWMRLRKTHKIANLPEYLLFYRVHEESVTRRDTAGQLFWVHIFFSRHTGLNISFEAFLELTGATQNFGALRRALLRWRLARSIHKPYRYFWKEDLKYARFRARAIIYTALNSAYRGYRRIKNTLAPNASPRARF